MKAKNHLTPPPTTEDDPLRTAHGIMAGVFGSIPLWAIIGFGLYVFH